MTTLPQTSGIYKITCLPTGKVYIGSSINISERCSEHRALLRAQKHYNPHMQNSWNKYQECNFSFEVVELVLIPCLLEREQYWMDRLKSYTRDRGFNIARYAGASARGLPVPEATRRKISLAHLGKPKTPEHVENIRKGQLGRKATAATRQKLRESHLGYKIRPETKEKLRKAMQGRVVTWAFKSGMSRSRYYVAVRSDGYVFRFRNLSKFCRDQGLQQSAMQKVVSGKYKQHRGWQLRYATDQEIQEIQEIIAEMNSPLDV